MAHRKSRHIQCVRKGVDRHLYNAMRKYGIENFVFEEIDRADNLDELNYLEAYYIIKYDSVRNGYNMGYGGDNNVMFSDVVYEKHKSHMQSPEVRKKISDKMKQYRKEHPFTDEHRKKLSEKAMGNHNFGTGDTRSIPCYCIVNNNVTYHFKNYKEAGIWWYKNYHPFGDKYSQATYQRKIIDCIDKGYCEFRKHRYDFDYIKWYREVGGAK